MDDAELLSAAPLRAAPGPGSPAKAATAVAAARLEEALGRRRATHIINSRPASAVVPLYSDVAPAGVGPRVGRRAKQESKELDRRRSELVAEILASADTPAPAGPRSLVPPPTPPSSFEHAEWLQERPDFKVILLSCVCLMSFSPL